VTQEATPLDGDLAVTRMPNCPWIGPGESASSGSDLLSGPVVSVEVELPFVTPSVVNSPKALLYVLAGYDWEIASGFHLVSSLFVELPALAASSESLGGGAYGRTGIAMGIFYGLIVSRLTRLDFGLDGSVGPPQLAGASLSRGSWFNGVHGMIGLDYLLGPLLIRYDFRIGCADLESRCTPVGGVSGTVQVRAL
jgi:hypothetical protein